MNQLKVYFAPLEGITLYHYRYVHQKYYKGIDKYFIPFLKTSKGELLNKDKKEIDPTNNKINAKVVPQILSKNVNETLAIIKQLEDKGYDEVNLNFACPSATVVPKGKGGGILKDLKLLNDYLASLFSQTSMKISIKMRVGLETEEEFIKIIEVLNQYPIYELIIHPRLVVDHYTGPIHLSLLDGLNQKTNFDIIYNGDIQSKEDIDKIKQRFPFIKGVMIGRGLITHPDLLEEKNDVKKLRSFYNELIDINRKTYGLNNSLFYEKELWAFLKDYFVLPPNICKKINKAKNVNEMDEVIEEAFKCGIKK